MAMFVGILRGSRKTPPAPATNDRLTSGRPNAAVRDATTRSQASVISHPPASAGPSTAAITGLVRTLRANPANPPRAVERPPPDPAAMALRSAPALNTGH